MNGNTRIGTLGTVKQNALDSIKYQASVIANRDNIPNSRLYKLIGELVSEFMITSKPGTIGGVITSYLFNLTDEQYKRFAAEVKRYIVDGRKW